jgi:hypothetical protein
MCFAFVDFECVIDVRALLCEHGTVSGVELARNIGVVGKCRLVAGCGWVLSAASVSEERDNESVSGPLSPARDKPE